jgi:hypothetical protein
MMTIFMAAKKAYVPQPIVANMGPVTLGLSVLVWIDQISAYMTTKKFQSQLDAVESAFAGARIRIGVTSAG